MYNILPPQKNAEIMHGGYSTKTRFYKGNDLLVTLKSALLNNEIHIAQKALHKYYKFYSLPSPNILRSAKLNVGGKVKNIATINSKNLVSIIVTTYNEEKNILNAINSLTNQSWLNIEIIVVDDGSTDNTKIILQNLSSIDSRIKFISLSENIGVYKARNEALKHVKGDFITFQDADDWSHPLRLELQIKPLLMNNLYQGTLSKFFRINTETGLPFAIRVYPLHRLNPSSLMIRRELIDDIGDFDTETRAGGDTEYIDRIKALNGDNSILILQEPLAIGAYRPNSLTSSGEAKIEENGKSEYRERYLQNYTSKHKKLTTKLTIKSQIMLDTETRADAYFIGFSPWKTYIKDWFKAKNICYLPKDLPQWKFLLLYKAKILKSANPQFFSWGYKLPNYIKKFAKKNYIPIFYIEDGFLRSTKLGAEKQPPCSLTIDTQAPYFDATQKTDLEDLLNHYDFESDPALISRAREVMKNLIDCGISKYNQASPVNIEGIYGIKNKKRILVIGQVEDDASIKYGCETTINNEQLINLVCEENPDAQIIYKPHPDVWYGYRNKLSNVNRLKEKCLILDQDISIAQAFQTIDHVYTITSLAGFEALIRKIPVTTIGCPFYAGWGLTDTRQANPRRVRNLTIEQIFASAYILYPRYFNPNTNLPTTVEEIINLLKS